MCSAPEKSVQEGAIAFFAFQSKAVIANHVQECECVCVCLCVFAGFCCSRCCLSTVTSGRRVACASSAAAAAEVAGPPASGDGGTSARGRKRERERTAGISKILHFLFPHLKADDSLLQLLLLQLPFNNSKVCKVCRS